MYKDLSETLTTIKNKLYARYGDEYHIDNNGVTRTNDTTYDMGTTVTYPILMALQSPSTTIINANSIHIERSVVVKKKKEENDDSTRKLISGIGIGSLVYIGTFLFAKDKYIRMQTFNSIDSDISTLRVIKEHLLENMLNNGTRLDTTNNSIFCDITNLLLSYERWKVSYERKYKLPLYSKIGTLLSAATFFGGLWFNNTNVIVLSSGGFLANTFYLLWNYLTTNSTVVGRQYDNDTMEYVKLNNLIDSLLSAIIALNNSIIPPPSYAS